MAKVKVETNLPTLETSMGWASEDETSPLISKKLEYETHPQ